MKCPACLVQGCTWMALITLLLGLPLTKPGAAGLSGGPGTSIGKESPFACAMTALAPAERKQHFEEYGPRLRKLGKSVRELTDGYEFEFDSSASTYRMLSAWMYQERLCCPFFDLSLRLDREGGSLWLRLQGREGVKEFIVAEFEPWFRSMAAR